jgi:hypothetical protein
VVSSPARRRRMTRCRSPRRLRRFQFQPLALWRAVERAGHVADQGWIKDISLRGKSPRAGRHLSRRITVSASRSGFAVAFKKFATSSDLMISVRLSGRTCHDDRSSEVGDSTGTHLTKMNSVRP